MALGEFNGAYLSERPFPDYPWLVRTGSPRGTLQHNSWIRDVLADAATWEHPLARSALRTPPVERLLRLWDEQAKLFDALERVPFTLCHLDAWRGNFFAPLRPDGTPDLVLIDWAFPGRGPLGADAGDLFGESFGLADVPTNDPSEFDRAIFEGYLQGLRHAGWSGDPRIIRFAFAAFCSLKHLLFVIILKDAADESKHARWEHLFGRPMEDLVCRQISLLCYLLNLADEARDLVGVL
jgi:hypothetical protein